MPSDDYFRWAERLFDPEKVFGKPEALRDVRVLDFTIVVLGPVISAFLGELGAEVIKVEMPGTGDRMIRAVSPWAKFWKNAALNTLQEGRNKYHVAVDVRKPEGREVFTRLAAKSDVLVENFIPGTLDEWGVGYRQLQRVNPRLIYVAASGFGQWGSLMKMPSYDAVAQSVSGLASITGFEEGPPTKAGTWVGDYFTALMAATGVLTALHHRDRTRRGQFIELGQAECLMRIMDWTWTYLGLTGRSRSRSGNRDQAVYPADAFKCRDGYVALGAASDEQFQALCRALGRPEIAIDPRFKDFASRVRPENAAELRRILEELVSGRSRSELDQLGSQHGFAAAPVMDFGEIYRDEHYRRRRAVWLFEDPVYGETALPGPVPKMSETPPRVKWTGRPVGFHNEYVFTKLLGLTKPELEELERKGVIGKWLDMVGRKPPDDWTGEGRFF